MTRRELLDIVEAGQIKCLSIVREKGYPTELGEIG